MMKHKREQTFRWSLPNFCRCIALQLVRMEKVSLNMSTPSSERVSSPRSPWSLRVAVQSSMYSRYTCFLRSISLASSQPNFWGNNFLSQRRYTRFLSVNCIAQET